MKYQIASDSDDMRSMGARAARRQIRDVLQSDSQFDAFCVDFFPGVYREFSVGMDRTRKENILLEHVSPAALFRGLYTYRTQSDAGVGPFQRQQIAEQRRTFSYLALVLIATISLGVMVWDAWIHPAMTLYETMVRNAAFPAKITAESQRAAVVTSTPPQAIVVKRRTGEILGHTPWTLPASETDTADEICIRAAGYRGQIVRFDQRTFSNAMPLHIVLSPNEDRETADAPRKDLCNAPTPMVH